MKQIILKKMILQMLTKMMIMFSGIGIEKYFILLLLKIMSLFLIGKNEIIFLHFTVMKGER